MRGAATLPALGIAEIAGRALATGSASGATNFGPVSIGRLGSDGSAVLVAEFGTQPNEARSRRQPLPKPSRPPLRRRQHRLRKPMPRRRAVASAREQDETERRHPLRFVWQMDADGRFVVGSDEFVELMGPRTTAAFGRLWSEIAAELKLDPENQIARAVATRETWSGVTVSWPVDDGGERLPIELSGTAGIRPRPHFSRLSGLRHLPRSRSHQPSAARTPRASDRFRAATAAVASARSRTAGRCAYSCHTVSAVATPVESSELVVAAAAETPARTDVPP